MRKRAQDRVVPEPLVRKQSRYTEDEKIAAVTIMLECGGMTVEAINLIRQHLQCNVSTDTLYKWQNQYKDKITAINKSLIAKPVDYAATIETTRQATAGMIDDLMHSLLNGLADDDVLSKASLRDRIVSYGILFDKRRIMTGLSPKREAQMRRIEELCRTKNYSADTIVDDFITALEQAADNNYLASDVTIE